MVAARHPIENEIQFLLGRGRPAASAISKAIVVLCMAASFFYMRPMVGAHRVGVNGGGYNLTG